ARRRSSRRTALADLHVRAASGARLRPLVERVRRLPRRRAALRRPVAVRAAPLPVARAHGPRRDLPLPVEPVHVSVRVTIVGGGSAQWVPILVDDIVIAPCLAGAELVLEDVDAARVERTREYATHVARLAPSGVTVRATTDLDDALTGADFVVVCIS